MLARLGDRLALLTAGPRAAADRHRTLRAAIGWSYDLLSEAEKAAYRSVLTVLSAMHHRVRGGWHVTRRFAQECLAIERAGTSRPGTLARALEVLASAEAHTGNPELAWQLLDEAVDLLGSTDDKLARGMLLNSYGWTLLQHGEAELAAPLVRESLTLIRLLGQPHMLNPALHTAGAIALARKSFPEAVALFRRVWRSGPSARWTSTTTWRASHWAWSVPAPTTNAPCRC